MLLLSDMLATVPRTLIAFDRAFPHPFLFSLPRRGGPGEQDRGKVLWTEDGASRPDVETVMEQTVFFVAQKSPRAVRDRVFIGRTKDNDIVIEEPQVSDLHAWIETVPAEDAYRLVDAASRNRTLRNDIAMNKGETVPLRFGDLIQVGAMRLEFLSNEQAFERARLLALALKR